MKEKAKKTAKKATKIDYKELYEQEVAERAEDTTLSIKSHKEILTNFLDYIDSVSKALPSEYCLLKKLTDKTRDTVEMQLHMVEFLDEEDTDAISDDDNQD